MGLFKRKKKVEVIDLEHFNKSHIFETDIMDIQEEEKEENDNINVTNYEPNESYESKVKEFVNAAKNYDSVIREYYMCKIFSRVDLDDIDFNAQVVELDKYINDFKKIRVDAVKNIDAYEKEDKDEGEEKRIEMILDSYCISDKVIMQRLKDINNNYYGQLKITTVGTCLNKTNDELEQLYNRISDIVSKHNTMDEAANDIYYKSGEFIVSMVKELVHDISFTRNEELISKYDYNYFLSSDVVITLDKKEWVELFNKVKLVVKLIQGIEIGEYLIMKDKFDYFEAIYTIIMMKSEMNTK